MEMSEVIALLSLLSTITLTLIGWYILKGKDSESKNDLIITLKAKMEYITTQLDKIDTKLSNMETSLNKNALMVAKHDSDITTLYKYLKLHIYRIRRLENHVGIKGEDEKEDERFE